MQTKMRFAVAAALFCLSASSLAAPPALYTNAVAQIGRPAEAVALDAGRKPAEVLEFLGLKSGMAAAVRVPLPADPAVGDTACAQAGVEIADSIVINIRKSHRFMLPSVSR